MTLSPQPIVSPETAEVVFEDDEIVVLNKHSGLLVLPDRYDRSIPNLYGLLKKKYRQIYVVHKDRQGNEWIDCLCQN
jgi:23S rRNA-/tRNA-specific pseudouridylate synthase